MKFIKTLLLFLIVFQWKLYAQPPAPVNQLRESGNTPHQGMVAVSLINPRDCINCYPFIALNLKYFLQQNDVPRDNLFFIMPTMRKAEKDLFLKNEMKGVLSGYSILENDTLFNAFLKSCPQILPTAALIIYNSDNAMVFAGNYRNLDKTALAKALKR